MRHLYTICAFCSLLVIGFVGCQQENIGALYEDITGVTFSNSKLDDITVQINDPTFTIDLLRADSSTPLTGQVTLEAADIIVDDTTSIELEGVTVSDYSFQVGETRTTITVNVEPLEIGDLLSMTFSLPDGVVTPVDGIGTTSVDVRKSYNWQPLGKGTFCDNFFSGVTYEVEIQKAEGFDRYRVLDPYVESLKNVDVGLPSWIAPSSAPHVEFWTTENNLVSFQPFFVGLYYQGNSKNPIYAYHASAFVGIPPTFSKWIDSKTVQLAPMYYMTGLGGWNYTQANDVIIITLP
jgi:hypothetical protein